MWSNQNIFKSIQQENNLINHFNTNPFYYVIFLSYRPTLTHVILLRSQNTG